MLEQPSVRRFGLHPVLYGVAVTREGAGGRFRGRCAGPGLARLGRYGAPTGTAGHSMTR